MARSAIQSRLNYLESSAYLLALAGPQTSAFLQAEHTRLLENNKISSEDRAKEVCGTCSTIMLPGLTAKIRKEEDKIVFSRNKTDIQSTRASRRIPGRRAHVCFRCSSVTKYSIIDKKCNALPSVKGLPELVDGRQTATTSDAQTCDQALKRKEYDSAVRNKSSKSRARARKKDSLQEMLAKSKRNAANISQNTGFGFDLMDFMKES